MRFHWEEFPPARLARAKGGQRVSVCVPARDEAATIGPVVAWIRELAGPGDLVDEILVVDDGSTDGTAGVAASAGATVVRAADVLAWAGPGTGKGEALWKALHASTGDLLVFVDADLEDAHAGFVTGLLGPLLEHDGIAFVKATYDRGGGGRVTELLARPLLTLLFPHLDGIEQPLGGEFAARREVLEAVPFAPGYGVDLGLLVDVAAHAGVEAIAQVDLGVRRHRNRPLSELRPQAEAVLHAGFRRAGVPVAGDGDDDHPPDRPPLRTFLGARTTPTAVAPPETPAVTTTLYVDVDGTLVGPGGDLLWDGSRRVVEALLAARRHGLAVVPVTGRGQAQVRELTRLLGLPRGIAELGCLHVEGPAVRYNLGAFPRPGGDDGPSPVTVMLAAGAVEAMATLGLEPHDPWNVGREATFLLRGRPVDHAEAGAALAGRGLGWCELVDNGLLARRPGQRVFHLAPRGTGKAAGVRHDRVRHGLARPETAYVGDAAADLACAPEVGRLWLVANADPHLDWPRRTTGSFGDGVAEVIDVLIGARRTAKGTVGTSP